MVAQVVLLMWLRRVLGVACVRLTENIFGVRTGLLAGLLAHQTPMSGSTPFPSRTTTHYQYRHDVGMLTAMSILWNEGGIARFYEGLPAALIQARAAATSARGLAVARKIKNSREIISSHL